MVGTAQESISRCASRGEKIASFHLTATSYLASPMCCSATSTSTFALERHSQASVLLRDQASHPSIERFITFFFLSGVLCPTFKKWTVQFRM